jgi:hypothetical protein
MATFLAKVHGSSGGFDFHFGDGFAGIADVGDSGPGLEGLELGFGAEGFPMLKAWARLCRSGGKTDGSGEDQAADGSGDVFHDFGLLGVVGCFQFAVDGWSSHTANPYNGIRFIFSHCHLSSLSRVGWDGFHALDGRISI